MHVTQVMKVCTQDICMSKAVNLKELNTLQPLHPVQLFSEGNPITLTY